jgi:hypothetical protein
MNKVKDVFSSDVFFLVWKMAFVAGLQNRYFLFTAYATEISIVP